MTKFDFPVVNREDYITYFGAYSDVKKKLDPLVMGNKYAYLFAYCHYDNLYNLYYRDHDEFSDPDFVFYIELYKMLMSYFKGLFIAASAFDCFNVDFSDVPGDTRTYYYDKKGELI